MNVKYTQLTLPDIALLRRALVAYQTDAETRDRIGKAIHELIEKAQQYPKSSICLAHAVSRG